MNHKIRVLETEDKEFEKFLNTKIKEYNNSKSPHHKESREPGSVTPINIIINKDSERIAGGLAATTYWEWLDIDTFYIPEGLRGRGLGPSLLQPVVNVAVKRGCTKRFLIPFQFQGRIFYEKQGYYVTGKLEDYPPGSTYHWMRKELILQ